MVVSWISTCIQNPIFSTSLNNRDIIFFSRDMGTEARLPRGTLPFILVMQQLSDLLAMEVETSRFTSHQFCKIPLVIHLAFFANDFFIFAKSNLTFMMIKGLYLISLRYMGSKQTLVSPNYTTQLAQARSKILSLQLLEF